MILSVSRRTDIPAYYSEWFFNRLKEGFVLVRNPFNTKQISKVYLNPELVDCIVFWTKNPERMLNRLDELNKFNYYFQFTLNSYDESLETNVPKKKYLMNIFTQLSQRIGSNRIVWRYDPIILTDHYTIEYHLKWFEFLANKLSKYTNICVISFVDLYRKTQRNLKNIKLKPITLEDIDIIACNFAQIASKYNLKLQTCSQAVDLDKYGIDHGKCIDDKIISRIIGEKITVDRDTNQRDRCNCVKSIDIGEYNTCKHGCLYCYANYSNNRVEKNVIMHDNKSPLLVGNLNGTEKITERKMESYIKKQISFF